MRQTALRRLHRLTALGRVTNWRRIAREIDGLRAALRLPAPPFASPAGQTLTVVADPPAPALPTLAAPRPVRPRPALIDLSSAPSSMEARAREWGR